MIVVDFVECLSLLEMAPSILDHRWPQDSPMFPLTSAGNWDIVSTKEHKKLGFEIVKLFENRV